MNACSPRSWALYRQSSDRHASALSRNDSFDVVHRPRPGENHQARWEQHHDKTLTGTADVGHPGRRLTATAVAAEPPLKTLPSQQEIWITGTIERGKGQYAPGTIRPSGWTVPQPRPVTTRSCPTSCSARQACQVCNSRFASALDGSSPYPLQIQQDRPISEAVEDTKIVATICGWRNRTSDAHFRRS